MKASTSGERQTVFTKDKARRYEVDVQPDNGDCLYLALGAGEGRGCQKGDDKEVLEREVRSSITGYISEHADMFQARTATTRMR